MCVPARRKIATDDGNENIQVHTSEDAELIRKQRFGLFIALALAREQYELWERMQVTLEHGSFGSFHANPWYESLLGGVAWHCIKREEYRTMTAQAHRQKTRVSHSLDWVIAGVALKSIVGIGT